MARKPYKINQSKYDIEQRPGETNVQYLRRLSHDADRRMLRLEALSKQKGFENVLNWSYAKAQRDIAYWTKGKGKRFETIAPATEAQIIAKISDVKSFLTSATSTKGSIVSTYKKRANTINERYGTSFTWDELAKFYESGANKKWDEMFGSKTALRTIAQIQKNEKQVVQAIKDNNLRDIRITPKTKTGKPSKLLEKTVNKALQSNSLNIGDLFE